MTTQPKFCIATNDNGYAAHKIAYYDDKAKRIVTLKVPAVISSGHGQASASGELMNAYSIVGSNGAETFTCSPNTDQPIDLRHAKYPLTTENRVLFTHALNEAGLLDKQLQMTITLPLADYYMPNGSINNALVEQVIENFTQNNVQPDGGENKGVTPQVMDLKVSPEAVAAWFDWAMDEQGNVNDNFVEMAEDDGLVLVVDVGGSTTDIVALTLGADHQLTVLNEKSGTSKIGVLDVIGFMEERFIARLCEEGVIQGTGHENLLSSKMLERMLTAETIRFGGQPRAVADIREEGTRAVAGRIVNFIRNKAGNTLSYHSIIVVGGGSIVFKDALASELGGNAIFLDEFANARGALKLALSMREDG